MKNILISLISLVAVSCGHFGIGAKSSDDSTQNQPPQSPAPQNNNDLGQAPQAPAPQPEVAAPAPAPAPEAPQAQPEVAAPAPSTQPEATPALAAPQPEAAVVVPSETVTTQETQVAQLGEAIGAALAATPAQQAAPAQNLEFVPAPEKNEVAGVDVKVINQEQINAAKKEAEAKQKKIKEEQDKAKAQQVAPVAKPAAKNTAKDAAKLAAPAAAKAAQPAAAVKKDEKKNAAAVKPTDAKPAAAAPKQQQQQPKQEPVVVTENPLQSLSFSLAYSKILPVVDEAMHQGLTNNVAEVLASDMTSLEVKAAIINAMGTGKTNTETYVKYLKNNYVEVENLSAQNQFVIGFLAAMDEPSQAQQALVLLEKAQMNMPKSLTVALVKTIVETQILAQQKDWAAIKKAVLAVKNNKNLKYDMKYQSLRMIYQYYGL